MSASTSRTTVAGPSRARRAGPSWISPRPTLAEIRDYLDEYVTYQPYGRGHVEIEAERTPGGFLSLSMTMWQPQSRGYDFEGGRNDDLRDETALYIRPIDATVEAPWPESLDDLREDIARLVTWQAAHEALEWLYDLDADRLIHDPHVDGDVRVEIESL